MTITVTPPQLLICPGSGLHICPAHRKDMTACPFCRELLSTPDPVLPSHVPERPAGDLFADFLFDAITAESDNGEEPEAWS